MSTRLCVSIPPKTVDEAFDLIQQAEEQHADIIEVRLDSLQDYKRLADIATVSKTPLIATNKSTQQNGSFSGTEQERQKVLTDAAKTGFSYIDIDLGTPYQKELIRSLKDYGSKVIVSYHDFQSTPSLLTLSNVLDEQLSLGSNVCKLITTAKKVEDNLAVLNFVSDASKLAEVVCFAMGELGKTSRLLSPVFGAFFTFACLDETKKTANGQLTIQEMKQAYETLGIK
ncbi:MAG: type I 3-dehydroquinate dehydratase [Candidatus Bathyarchaeum sp.]|nr:MAG: type I 3-dehydroquinate dehydratase [Candidatus Bathyarchaeum sp.]